MNKKTKTAIGIGAVAIVGYLIYKNYQNRDKAFANLRGRLSTTLSGAETGGIDCNSCRFVSGGTTTPVGTTYFDKSCSGKRFVIVSKSASQILVCPEGQTSVMPVSLNK
jgi:hypothetical protein